MEIKKTDWEEAEEETLKDGISRKVIHGTNVTLAQLHFGSGKSVQKHSHESEQVSLVLRGKVSFDIEGRTIEVSEGSMLFIPPNVPHGVTALEDSIVVDTFSPPRNDWLAGKDSYLRS